MEAYKKAMEYKALLNDGVISEAEFNKLKDILYTSKMEEVGIGNVDEFEELIKKEYFKEAILLLEKNDAPSYRIAISMLENLGDWGNATNVIEKCRYELSKIETAEEEKAKEDLYNNALRKLRSQELSCQKEALNELESLGDWKDASNLAEEKRSEILKLEKEAKNAKESFRRKIIGIIIMAGIACVAIAFLILMIPDKNQSPTLPTGVRLGESYHEVREIAISLDPNAEVSGKSSIQINTEVYGYKSKVYYHFSGKQKKVLTDYTVEVSEYDNLNEVYESEVKKLTEDFGTPKASGAPSQTPSIAHATTWDIENVDVAQVFLTNNKGMVDDWVGIYFSR